MKAFLDTSSLIKLYHQEEGSDFVMDRVNNFYLTDTRAKTTKILVTTYFSTTYLFDGYLIE